MAESLASPYVKVAIHCFNHPYAACEYQNHDARPAHRPTVAAPFATEGPQPCRENPLVHIILAFWALWHCRHARPPDTALTPL
ncbi:hypothetical protein QJS63_15785 [Pseudomonas juntendi]|nr:hypothetical protein QJS63_15785 [Pseudomonas juntendi]